MTTMPDLKGLDVVRIIDEQEGMKEVGKVIMATAFA